ncbi:MAG: hypothetical protein ACRELB_24370, partial [Polyangiaceae bacterium]
CDTCWDYVALDAPICVGCASELQSRRPRIVAVTVAFVLTAGALLFFVSRHMPADFARGAAVGVAIASLLGIVVAVRRLRVVPDDEVAVRRRDEEDVVVAEPLAPGEGPYRARFARVASRALPRTSARATALVIALSFVATASLVPFSLHLPEWERSEVVLAGWWLVGVVALTALLCRGARLADDYAYRAPWDQRAERTGAATSSRTGSSTRLRWPSGFADVDDSADDSTDGGEGCAGAIVGVLLAALALAAAWLVVELVAPLLFFIFYALVVRAVGRVMRDNRDCAGNLLRSFAWAAAWSTIYLVPLATAVWGIHALFHIGYVP